MNELDAIKKRAAERRIRRERYSTLGNPELATEAEADLDRAIAIAEQIMQMKMPLKLYAMGLEAERDEARADVLKFRDAYGAPMELQYNSTNANKAKHKLWTDTESYEDYRTVPDAE